MTREEIENYDKEKVRTMDDFVAFCGYHDSDFCYEWKEYTYERGGYKRIDYDRPRLELWVPFDELDMLTGQVLGNAYFEDGHFAEVSMYDGGVYIGPDEVEQMLEYLGIENPEEVFPYAETSCSYPDFSTQEKIDAYFKHLEELRIRPENSNPITQEEDDDSDEEQ